MRVTGAAGDIDNDNGGLCYKTATVSSGSDLQNMISKQSLASEQLKVQAQEATKALKQQNGEFLANQRALLESYTSAGGGTGGDAWGGSSKDKDKGGKKGTRGKGWFDKVKEFKKSKGTGDGGQGWQKKKTTWQSGGAWNAH